ncbi:AI-2E family transporter [Vibrio barjaei]|uniref:AI-2E family transporter n=1 Tax=Vibrio barjaei TaxID=1676683 RepID=UPI002283439B|nr:AI-2E family transporter [Vibrio barjaei]MCY9872994.1 AI-2E family transporter [Vibrio barjaei]
MSALVKSFWGENNRLLLWLLFMVSFVLIVASFAMPVFVAAVFAFVLNSLINRLHKLLGTKVKAVAVMSVSVILLGYFLVFNVKDIVGSLVSMLEDLDSSKSSLLMVLDQMAFLSPDQMVSLKTAVSKELTSISFSDISFAPLLSVIDIGVYFALVPVLLAMFMVEGGAVRLSLYKTAYWFCSYASSPKRKTMLMGRVDRLFSRVAWGCEEYVVWKFFECLILAAMAFTAFGLGAEMKHALLLSLIVGLSVFLPFLGAVIAYLPVSIVALAQFGSIDAWLIISSLYVLIQVVDGFVVVPALFGAALNISPLAVMLSIMCFGALFGLWGVILAIPLLVLMLNLHEVFREADEI